MAEIKATIQFKRATSSKWAQLNPILANGVPCYEKDTGKLKIGDGVSTWEALDYLITEEIDPTVSSWAKQENKPTYTASEVGAYNKSEVDTKLNSKANSSHTHTMANISDLKNQVPKNATIVSSGYDLNNYNSSTHCGYYYAGGGNNCLSKPSGVDAFGLQIVKNADGYIMQILYASNNSKNDIYTRVYGGGAWSGWEKLAQSGDLNSKANKSDLDYKLDLDFHNSEFEVHINNTFENDDFSIYFNEIGTDAYSFIGFNPSSASIGTENTYLIFNGSNGKLLKNHSYELLDESNYKNYVYTKAEVDNKINNASGGSSHYIEYFEILGGDDIQIDWTEYQEVSILLYSEASPSIDEGFKFHLHLHSLSINNGTIDIFTPNGTNGFSIKIDIMWHNLRQEYMCRFSGSNGQCIQENTDYSNFTIEIEGDSSNSFYGTMVCRKW